MNTFCTQTPVPRQKTCDRNISLSILVLTTCAWVFISQRKCRVSYSEPSLDRSRTFVTRASTFSDGSFYGGAQWTTVVWPAPVWTPHEIILVDLVDLASVKKKFHILFIGDSVDRLLIDDGCDGLTNSTRFDWAEGVFRPHKESTYASQTCDTPWGSFSYLHHYGAPQTGPYLKGHKNDDADPYTDTPWRFRHGIATYIDRFGFAPTAVVYQSCLWDVFRVIKEDFNPLTTKRLIAEYERDVQSNIKLLRALLPPTSIVFTRTTPNSGHIRMFEYTNALRRTSVVMRVGVLDWERMTSGEIAVLGKGFFRDEAHPNPAYSRSFVIAVARFVATFT